LGDVREIDKNIEKITKEKVQLVVTSPPYLKITSYEEDQWLRLWFLGYPPIPSQGKITKDDRISSQDKYIDFLGSTWKTIYKVMKRGGIIVCRIGQSAKDSYPLKDIINDSIKRSGVNLKLIKQSYSPFKKIRQAQMFGGQCLNSGEYDFVIKVF
jgi:tRNA G10  N-methylase Trm11